MKGVEIQMPAKLDERGVERLRSLGRQIREIAELDVMQENKKLWTALNDGKMIRPVLLSRGYPYVVMQDGPFAKELEPEIEDDYWQIVEKEMLMVLYEWRHMSCDWVIEPKIRVPVAIHDTGFGMKQAGRGNAKWTKQEELNKAYGFEVQLKEDDVINEKIHFSEVSFDEEETKARMEYTQEIMDGILKPEYVGMNGFHFDLGDDILSWTTLQQGMEDLIIDPGYLIEAAYRYVECFIDNAKQYERLGLLSSNNTNVFVGQGGYGYCSELPEPTESGIGCKLSDMWGSAQDQILTSISPGMTKEFAFEPEVEWAKLFPRLYYGCCERMDNKIDEVKILPSLKKISVSPFSKHREAMEKIGPDYIVSYKPTNLLLTQNPVPYDRLREELENVCRWAREYNCSVEVLMKSIISLNGEPQRLFEYCEMAHDIVKNW